MLEDAAAADLVHGLHATWAATWRSTVSRVGFGRTILELGGNNAVVLMEDADLDLAHPGDPLRRGRHRRPALHQHAPRARARVDRRRRGAAAGQGLRGQVNIGDPLRREAR